jgi:magnesium transporter
VITVYCRLDARVVSLVVPPEGVLPAGAVWIDLLAPTPAEIAFIARAFSIELPTPEDMKEIESSSRLYAEDDAVFMTTSVIYHSETDRPDQCELSFVLAREALVTVRYQEPKSIPTFVSRINKQPDLLASPEAALLGLLDAVVDRVADVLEIVGARIDVLANSVFTARLRDNPKGRSAGGRAVGRAAAREEKRGQATEDLQEVLRGIGRAGDITHKIRDTLAGMDRLAAYLASATAGRLSKDHKAALKTLQRDIRSLNEHVGFLSHEAAFLLDATLGLVNLEQNRIIKIFSVAAVAFLPPTLVGTIYGMNFEHMPELEWALGYPVALLLMVLSGVLPLVYFRWRGWL